MDTPPDDHILLGTLGRTFQLEGGLRFRPLGAAEREAIASLREVFVTGRGVTPIKRVRTVGDGLVIYLAGVPTIEAAKALVNEELYAPESDLPEPASGLPYVELVAGLPVFLDGEAFGEVNEILEAGGQELLAIDRDGEEVLVPLRADYVTFDDDGVHISDPPAGLLDLHRPE